MDAIKKRIAQGYSEHEPISVANGHGEQDHTWWIEAFLKVCQSAVESSNIQTCEIKDIGISDQQHGLLLDKKER